MIAGRPSKNYATEGATRQLQLSAVVLAVATSAVLVWQAVTRVDPIEVSYLFGEEADLELGTGSLWPLLVIALSFTVGSLMMSFVPAFGRFPAILTKENTERLYRAGERIHAWIAIGIQITVASGLIMLLLNERVSLVVLGVLIVGTAVIWFRGFSAMAREEFIRRELRGGK